MCTGWLSQWQCWSRSRLAEVGILALALAWRAFLIKAFQPSRSRPFLSIHSLMDGLRLLWKYRHHISLVRTHRKSNSIKMDLRCCGWEAQSYISSCWCWESLLILVQMLVTNAIDSPRLCRKKALNSSQVKGAVLSLSTWVLCYCQRKLILSRRNKAAKDTHWGPVAPAVPKWSLHCRQK